MGDLIKNAFMDKLKAKKKAVFPRVAVIVNGLRLTEKSVKAIQESVELTGDTITDTHNRAVQVYAVIMKELHSGKSLYVGNSPNDIQKLVIK